MKVCQTCRRKKLRKQIKDRGQNEDKIFAAGLKDSTNFGQKGNFLSHLYEWKPEFGVRETEKSSKLTAIDSLHGDVVDSILDKLWLPVDCVCNSELSSIFVNIDPVCRVCDLVITEKQWRGKDKT